MYDNSGNDPRLIAEGSKETVQDILDKGLWIDLTKRFGQR